MDTFERALSGELGSDAKQTAKRAVRDAVAKIADMFKTAKPFGGVSGFASGGTLTASKAPIRALDGECVLPLGRPLTEVEHRAFEDGYTELRFNPETMVWAYHRPDEEVDEDGRRYVRVRYQ